MQIRIRIFWHLEHRCFCCRPLGFSALAPSDICAGPPATCLYHQSFHTSHHQDLIVSICPQTSTFIWEVVMASSVLEEFMQTVVTGNMKKADINALHVKLDEVLKGLRGSGDEGDALRRDNPSVNVTHLDWDPSSDATMSDEDQASREHCASRSSSVVSAVLTPKLSSMNDPSPSKAKPRLPPGAKVLDVDDLATYVSFQGISCVHGWQGNEVTYLDAKHVADVIQWTSSKPGIEDGSSLREAWKALYLKMLDLQHRALKLQFPTTSLPTANSE